MLTYFLGASYRSCPGCGAHETIKPWRGESSPEAEQLWDVAVEREEEIWRRARVKFLILLLLILAASVAMAVASILHYS